MRLVIVEDDPLVEQELRGAFRREFRDARVDCLGSESSFLKALDSFNSDPPTLVVLDVMLPWGGTDAEKPHQEGAEFAGIRCASRLRQVNLPNAPWIILYTVWPTDQMPLNLTEQLKPLIIIDKDRGPRHVLKVAHSILRAQLPQDSIDRGDSDADRVFIAMPISDASLDTFGTITRAITGIKKGARPFRVDSKPGSFPIVEEIERAIDSCWLVVCDLTEERPNVYYELGYAVARGKRVICIAKRGTTLHFDVAGRKTLVFASYTALEKQLRDELLRLMKEERG